MWISVENMCWLIVWLDHICRLWCLKVWKLSCAVQSFRWSLHCYGHINLLWGLGDITCDWECYRNRRTFCLVHLSGNGIGLLDWTRHRHWNFRCFEYLGRFVPPSLLYRSSSIVDCHIFSCMLFIFSWLYLKLKWSSPHGRMVGLWIRLDYIRSTQATLPRWRSGITCILVSWKGPINEAVLVLHIFSIITSNKFWLDEVNTCYLFI